MKEEHKNNYKDLGGQILDEIGNSLNDLDFVSLSENIRSSVDLIREEAEKGYKAYRENAAKTAARNAERQRQMAKQRYNRHIVDDRPERYQTIHGYQYNRTQEEQPKDQMRPPRPVLKSIPGNVQGPVEMGFGISMLGLFGSAALVVLALGGTLGMSLPMTLIGGALLGHGIFARKRAKRLLTYDKILRGKEFVMLDKLEKESGQKMKQIKKDIHFLMEKGIAPGLSMDDKETCLLLTDHARQQYQEAEASRLEREAELQRQKEEQDLLEKKKASASKEEREWMEFQEAIRVFVKNLEDNKKEISSSEMVKHMEHVELLISQIYACIQEHPEMIGGTGHLISYYLPCMSKLINTYEDLEDQPIQGDNIVKTKKEIEASFDTIESALTNMYDELFMNVSMDISSDIQVLKAMMAQDGLNEEVTFGK